MPLLPLTQIVLSLTTLRPLKEVFVPVDKILMPCADALVQRIIKRKRIFFIGMILCCKERKDKVNVPIENDGSNL
jgi:hypothetical protein